MCIAPDDVTCTPQNKLFQTYFTLGSRLLIEKRRIQERESSELSDTSYNIVKSQKSIPNYMYIVEKVDQEELHFLL